MRLGLEDGPTLGQMIRAARMGFSWTGKSFLRISGDGPFKFEFYPCGLIPNPTRPSRTSYWVWWEGDPTLRQHPLFNVKAKRPFELTINDDGQVFCSNDGR